MATIEKLRSKKELGLIFGYRCIDKLISIGGTQDDKENRIQQNVHLIDYYVNKGRNPSKLLSDLASLASDMVFIDSPQFQISSDNSSLSIGKFISLPLQSLSEPSSGSSSHRGQISSSATASK